MLKATGQSIPASEWWRRRRLRYNIGLIVAGPLAFVCYVAVGFWGISIGAIQDPYASIPLMVVSHGMGYLVLMSGHSRKGS